MMLHESPARFQPGCKAAQETLRMQRTAILVYARVCYDCRVRFGYDN